MGGTECSREGERERGEGEVKDRGREHEEEAEEEGGGREGGRDQLLPDGFQQNKCVFHKPWLHSNKPAPHIQTLETWKMFLQGAF